MSGTHTLEFRLYGQAMEGTAFHAEQQDITLDAGLFTAYLGDGVAIDLGDGNTSPALSLAAFAERPLGVAFLGISVDGGAELTPRLQIGAVPFAAHAQTCGSASELDGTPLSSFATTDAASLTSGALDKARLPALTAADIASGTFDKARLPNMGDVYLERNRFAWGRHDLPVGEPPAKGDGSIYSGTPKTGSVQIALPNLGCAKPFAWVSANTGGTGNFIGWSVRHGELDNGKLWVDWVNLYHTQSFHISFEWLAFCP